MAKFLWGFLAGFGACLAITLAWYHGDLRPRIEELKRMAGEKLSGK